MGFYSVLIISILTEYLPIFLRGFVLNFVWFGWSLGSIYFLLLLKYFFPFFYHDKNETNTEIDKFSNANFSIVYIHTINVIITLFFFEDSPRNLLMNNNREKAGEILKYYVGRELNNQELSNIHNNIIHKGENKFCKNINDFGLFSFLFCKRYLKLCLFTMLVFFFYSFSMYGMSTALPAILESKSDKENHEKMTDFDFNKINQINLNYLIQYYSVVALSSLLGGILAEFKFLGKKYSEIIVISLSFLITLLAVLFANEFYILFTICALLIKSAFNLQISWTTVCLPTKFRTTGFGLFLGMTRLGGFISQFAFNGMVNNITLTIVIFMISLLGIIVFIIFLPKNEIEELDSELNLENNNDYQEKLNK
jgi:MFS family permease